MTTQPTVNYVCFFGDGPLWDNFIKIMAYPTGYSYFRPFRYRDEWIQDSILEMLHEKADDKLSGKAILGVCFINEDTKKMLLPLREIDVKHILHSNDQCSVQFTLGRMVDYRVGEQLSNMCLEVPDEDVGKLFFTAENQLADDSFASEDEEDDVWPNYCDKIAKDASLPINEDARRSLFLRAEFFDNTEPLTPELTHCSSLEGSRFGPILSEGKNYELVIDHRVPYLLGTNSALNSLNVEYKGGNSNIELNREEEEFSSNYQRHVIAITAKESSDIGKELIVDPGNKAVAVNEDTFINVYKLHIPYKIKLSYIHRFRRTYGFYLLFFIALLVINWANLLPEDLNINQILSRAVAPALATVAIFFAKNKT